MIRSYQIEGAYDRVVGEIEPLKNMRGLKTMSNYLLYRIFSVSTIHKVKTMINKKL